MKSTNKTALITGASDGIGFQLAKLFARDKYNLVIVADNKTKLSQAANELQQMASGTITQIVQDLSVPGAAEKVYKKTTELNIHVDVLVNDAGIGKFGLFTDTNIEDEIKIIQLNVITLVHLTKLYLRDMLIAKSGRILQVSSVQAYQPSPMLSVYGGTKAFILMFSDTIRYELRDTKITVTTLLPNATDTDFFRKAGMEHTKAAQEKSDDPAVVAEIGYDALMNGEPHAYGPGVLANMPMIASMPNSVLAKMVDVRMMSTSKKAGKVAKKTTTKVKA